MLKESTLLKGNLCIYNCFIDVLYIFYRVFKINWEMRPNLRLIFATCSRPFYLWEQINDSVSVTWIAFNGKLMGFRMKNFKKQFVCLLFSVCSFITLVDTWSPASKSYYMHHFCQNVSEFYAIFTFEFSNYYEFYLKTCVTSYSW